MKVTHLIRSTFQWAGYPIEKVLTMSMYLTRVRDHVARFGYWSFTKYALRAIQARAFSVHRLALLDLDITKPINHVTPTIDITYRIATVADLDSMGEDLGYDQKGRRFSRHRLTRGDRCVLAIHDNRIAGYIWIMEGEMELSQYKRIALPQSKMYIYKGFVSNEFRGKRVLNGIDTYIICLALAEGRRAIITTVDVNNRSSLVARERLCFKRVGEIVNRRVFGVEFDHIGKTELMRLQTL